MHRSSKPRLALSRTTLTRLDAADLRTVVGGKLRDHDDSFVASCVAAAYTGCGDHPQPTHELA